MDQIKMNAIICLGIFVLVMLYIYLRKAPPQWHGSYVKNLKISPRTKSEARAIKLLEEITGKKFPTVNPPWLRWRNKTMELDGYCEKLGIALEYSGPLHTKWYPAQETYRAYFERLVKDALKRKICEKNGVCLIVIDCSLPERLHRAYITSRLHDFGYCTKPHNYMPLSVVEPFRNPQLEREYKLSNKLLGAS